MNLNHLYYFRTLAKEEHYTRTAKSLSITQPSLSHAISCLEEELGVKLFEKQGRNAKLTKYGRIFLRYVEQSLEMLDEGKRILLEASGIQGGYVDIGYIYTLGSHFIPGMLKEYTAGKGEHKIHFSFGQGTTSQMIAQLKEGTYDFVFSSYVEGERDLDFYPVMEEELVLIAPCGHPLVEKQSVDLRDTIQYPYIAFAKNSGLRPVINHLFEQIQCRPSVAYEGEEDSSVAGLTAAGFGIAIIPNIPLLQTMDLEILPISSPKIRRYIYLVTKKNKYLAPAAKDFVDFVKKNYSVL